MDIESSLFHRANQAGKTGTSLSFHSSVVCLNNAYFNRILNRGNSPIFSIRHFQMDA